MTGEPELSLWLACIALDGAIRKICWCYLHTLWLAPRFSCCHDFSYRHIKLELESSKNHGVMLSKPKQFSQMVTVVGDIVRWVYLATLDHKAAGMKYNCQGNKTLSSFMCTTGAFLTAGHVYGWTLVCCFTVMRGYVELWVGTMVVPTHL